MWLRRNASATGSLRVDGRRLDGSERIQLTVPAASTTVHWPGGEFAHGYPSDVFLPSSGCWRFSIRDGQPQDTLIFRVE